MAIDCVRMLHPKWCGIFFYFKMLYLACFLLQYLRFKNLQTMKKTYVILSCVLALALTACTQNEEVYSLVGNYTYKVSGVVTVDAVGDTHLTPETGTMSITTTDKDHEVIMSFNHNGGDAYDIRANVTKDSIYIHPTHRYIEVEVAQDTLAFGTITHRNETYDVQVSGSGHMLSNGNVSFNLTYAGKALNDPNDKINGTNIFLHGTRNAK